jgi:acyl-CoA thioester hydrolase
VSPTLFSITIQVRYAECDMQGHVFNAHYLTWFDMAHTALLSEALGRPWSQLLPTSSFDVVVIESGVRHRAPAHFDDELRIEVALDPLTTSSMRSRYTVNRGDTRLAEGVLRHVCVANGTTEKLPWPEDARQALTPFIRE